MVLYVFLSHDVDWPRQGPSIDHIIERKERFDPIFWNEFESKNLYYNTPEIMEIEEKFGVKSTFFYRTKYENGDFLDYEDDIKTLQNGGWEIGLHSDPNSINNFESIKEEKNSLETLTKKPVYGNRVHYLAFNEDLPEKLSNLGFVYDSTFRNSKDRISKEDMGYYKINDILEFPLTIMDAYLFTYMKISENQIINLFEDVLNKIRKINYETNVITVNWHDNVLKMKGGRMYKKIIEFLANQKDVEILRGIDVVEKINTK